MSNNKKIFGCMILVFIFLILIVKVSAIAPSIEWNKTYDGGGGDHARAIAVDNLGNVYVTGYSQNSKVGSYDIYHTIKYDSNGNQIWNKAYKVDAHNAGAKGVAVDNLGNVYVTGYLINGTDEYYTIKYDTNGNEIWDISYSTGNSNQADAYAIAVDNFNHIYVTGDKSNGKNNDYYTVKYNDCNPLLVNSSWSSWSNIGNCSVQDEQNQSRYTMQYDSNYCGTIQNQTFYQYQEQFCDFCTPNWTAVQTCNPDDSLITWYNDSNSCFSQTNLSSDLQGMPNNQTIPFSCDYGHNGIIGNTGLINTNLNNLTLLINNSNNLSRKFADTQDVIVMSDDEKVLEFNFTFTWSLNCPCLINISSSNDSGDGSSAGGGSGGCGCGGGRALNLYNLSIIKQENTSDYASLIVKGLNLTSQNQTKIVYLDRILNGTGICIKDAEINSTEDISDSCTSTDETWLSCPSSKNGYTCQLVDNNSQYEISGLRHSGIKEQLTYCGDGACNGGESCSSCPADCGACPVTSSGGSGGGGGIIYTPKNNSILNKTNVSQTNKVTISSIVNKTNIPAINTATSNKNNSGFGITGAIIGVESGGQIIIVAIVLVVIFFVAIILIIHKRKSKYNHALDSINEFYKR